MNREINKKNKDYTVPVLAAVFATVLIIMIAVLCLPNKTKGEFVPPDFEPDAVVGVPEVAESFGYSELYKEGMAYRVSICGVPSVEGQNLTVYFTNTEGNEQYLKLRVFDESGNVLGETGLLRPGEYVKDVKLTKEISDGTKIRLKVMGYEPESYESAGSVTLNVIAEA